MHDDSSHYEISLTAGQAFTAFVLLLLSLAASFAFGVIIGRGGSTTSTPSPTEATITESAGSSAPEIDLPVAGEPAGKIAPKAEPKIVDREELPPEPEPAKASPAAAERAPEPVRTESTGSSPSSEHVPFFAQILSTREGPAAEALAAKLINDGFKTAYVERVPSEGGLIYRVRVRFPSESDARAAVPRLRSYAPGEIWVSHE